MYLIFEDHVMKLYESFLTVMLRTQFSFDWKDSFDDLSS